MRRWPSGSAFVPFALGSTGCALGNDRRPRAPRHLLALARRPDPRATRTDGCSLRSGFARLAKLLRPLRRGRRQLRNRACHGDSALLRTGEQAQTSRTWRLSLALSQSHPSGPFASAPGPPGAIYVRGLWLLLGAMAAVRAQPISRKLVGLGASVRRQDLLIAARPRVSRQAGRHGPCHLVSLFRRPVLIFLGVAALSPNAESSKQPSFVSSPDPPPRHARQSVRPVPSSSATLSPPTSAIPGNQLLGLILGSSSSSILAAETTFRHRRR